MAKNTFLIIDKSGSIKESSTAYTNVTNVLEKSSENIAFYTEIYKKCGYRPSKSNDGISDNFVVLGVYNKDSENSNMKHIFKNSMENSSIVLLGKNSDRAGKENKYEFAPPHDNSIYFGNVAVVLFNGDEVQSLTNDLWEQLYEKMFGGFDDCDTESESESSEDELENEDIELTKDGYKKDGFVVDDEDTEDEEDEDYNDDELTEEEYYYSDED